MKGQLGVSAKLVLILLAETIASWEEIPTSLLVHLPDVRLLELGHGEDLVTSSNAHADMSFLLPPAA